MKDSKQDIELQNFKSMALWLLSYKLFRDYIDVVNFKQNPEPEKFFEIWIQKCMPDKVTYSSRDKANIWRLFLDLLIARAESYK